jgi:hypothetical protein
LDTILHRVAPLNTARQSTPSVPKRMTFYDSKFVPKRMTFYLIWHVCMCR